MAAGMSDARQGVVFGIEDHETASGAILCQKCGFHTADGGLDLETKLGEEGDEVVVGLKFLVGELGVLKDLATSEE
jgi:hypothetical protein